MCDAVNSLFIQFGSHEKVAEILGYTSRHYRKNTAKKSKEGKNSPHALRCCWTQKLREIQTRLRVGPCPRMNPCGAQWPMCNFWRSWKR